MSVTVQYIKMTGVRCSDIVAIRADSLDELTKIDEALDKYECRRCAYPSYACADCEAHAMAASVVFNMLTTEFLNAILPGYGGLTYAMMDMLKEAGVLILDEIEFQINPKEGFEESVIKDRLKKGLPVAYGMLMGVFDTDDQPKDDPYFDHKYDCRRPATKGEIDAYMKRHGI